MLELIAIPTITTATVMTTFAVLNFVAAAFTVGHGVIAVAPLALTLL